MKPQENGIYIFEGLKDSKWKPRILYAMKIDGKMITTCPEQLKLKTAVGEGVEQMAPMYCWWERKRVGQHLWKTAFFLGSETCL